MGWVAVPIHPSALAEAMEDKGVGPTRLAEQVTRSSPVKVSRQRVAQLRDQSPPAGCHLELAEQISKVLGIPFTLLWRVEPTNETTRKLSPAHVMLPNVRNKGAQHAQLGRQPA